MRNHLIEASTERAAVGVRHVCVACLFLLITLAWRPAFSQNTPTQVAGVVVDESGGAIVGADVSVSDETSAVRRRLVTTNDGRFVVPGLPSGTFLVEAIAHGFRPARTTATLTSAEATVDVRIVVQVVGIQETLRISAQRASAGSIALGVEASVLDLPFSTTSVDAEDARAQGAVTLQDMLRAVPGAQPDLGFTGGHSQVFILRGSPATTGTGASRVLRDGTRLSNYAFVPAFTDRVDVLRGPGAAVGVRSEPGGTVNIVTKRPTLTNLFSASGEWGSMAAREAVVDVNRVLSRSHELAVRVTGVASNQAEWREVPNRLRGLKVGVAKSHGTRYRLDLGFEAARQTYRPDYGVPSVDGRPVDIPATRQLGEPWADSTTDNDIGDANLRLALTSRSTLDVGVAHVQSRSTSIRHSTGTFVAGAPAGTVTRSVFVEPDTRRSATSFNASFSHTMRTGRVSHVLFADVEHYIEDLDAPSGGVPTTPINIFAPVFAGVSRPDQVTLSSTMQDLESTALSFQDQLKAGAWTVTAGGRQIRQRFRYGAPDVQGAVETRFLPRVGVVRHLSGEQMVYASYGTGMAPNQALTATNQALPSRTSNQYEVGWKGGWMGGRLQGELAAFRLEHHHMPSPDLDAPQQFVNIDSGTARAVGVEAALAARVAPRMFVQASYGATDSIFVNHSTLAGNDMPGVARHSSSLWATYDWSASWQSTIGVTSRSGRWADQRNTTRLPGYVVVDATTRIQLTPGIHPVTLQLSVRNLFDTGYYPAAHIHVDRWIVPGEGRRATVSASYAFGSR